METNLPEENETTTTEHTAVADADTDPNKGTVADGGAAQDDGLDAILKEFDERKASTSKEDQPGTGQTKTADTAETDALTALKNEVSTIKAREARRELDKVVSGLRDGVQADDFDAEGYLNAVVAREPRLNDLYNERERNPKAWDKAFKALKQDFEKRFGKRVDKQATESRDAVAAAVHSASTAAPTTELTDKDIRSMSKADFDDAQRKLGVMPV